MRKGKKTTQQKDRGKAGLNPVKAFAGAARELLDIHKNYLALKDDEQAKRAAIEQIRDQAIEDIREKKDFLVGHLNRAYDARAKVLEKEFKNMDQALKTDDITTLSESLGTLIDTVSTSPMPDMETFLKDFHDTKKLIEI